MEVESAQSKDRILALEVRPRVTGFAVLEIKPSLLDWGTRKQGVSEPQLAGVVARKINALLDVYAPSAIVVRARNVLSQGAHGRIRTVIGVVRGEAKKRSVTFQTISTKAVRRFFAEHNRTTKYQAATLLAEWFPELSWKLPPKRKSWKSEHHRMVVFDAAATGLAFLGRSPPKVK
jgi:hypothetical protein